jgi:Zn-dependent protease with chaperone function
MRFRREQEAAENATWGMLIGFAAALVLIVVAVNAGLAIALRLMLPVVHGYPPLFFETNTAIVLLFVLGGCWIETLRLREGGARVARLAGARPADPAGRQRGARLERRLVDVVEEIAIAARTRPPSAWVLPRDLNINAFAAGWTADDAVIAVTQGALERLTRAELQGLVGHEMGHIVRGDMRLNTRLIGLVWGLQMVHGFGLSIAARDDQGRFRAGAMIGFALVAMGWLGWLAGRVLQAAVSRQREFGADASAVQYARTVDGIGGVLRKIAGLPRMDAPAAVTSLAHLWVAQTDDFGMHFWRRWMATHPPLDERLRRLYGRHVSPLDAPLLPPPSDDEGPPAAAVTPMVAGTDVGTKAGNNAGKSAGESMGNCAGTIAAFAAPMPPAVPTQTGRASAGVPESAAAAAPNSADPQDEHDALQRASHWRSRGECHAALLAWLIADAGDAAPWDAWHALAGDAPYVERLREDWFALGPAARWQVFDTLIARQRSAPAADRTALLAAARGLAPSGAARLRLLLLRRTLRLSEPPPGQLALEDLAPAFAAATTLLAQLIGPRGPAWAAGVGNEPTGVAAWATPWNAFPLRRLHAMQRPRVARAWAQSAAEAGLLQDAAVVGPLVAACRCLDTPVPATLAG